jgi:purine-nucleoside phosphorylase
MQAAVDLIRSRTILEPIVAVVLGSGLGGFAEALSDRVSIPYSHIPGWPPATVAGHSGQLIIAKLGELPVVVMSGRAHLYEGYSPEQVVYGVRVLGKLGIRTIVFTNAAGGINLEFSQGALALVSDHLNLQGRNPLAGANDDSLGARFPDMTDAYSSELRDRAKKVAQRLGIPLREAVYAGVLGPSFETPSEIRMLRTLGADLVGMSTVPEVIAARHMGIRCLAISCVTNMAAGILPQKITHEEVLETGARVRDTLTRLLAALLPEVEA